MSCEMKGSNLVRAMLLKGAKKVWCAVDDDSDEQAMMDHEGHDFTAYIVAYRDGHFYCSAGMAWRFAVPIRISEVVDDELVA